jgi:hypothetical protein
MNEDNHHEKSLGGKHPMNSANGSASAPFTHQAARSSVQTMAGTFRTRSRRQSSSRRVRLCEIRPSQPKSKP